MLGKPIHCLKVISLPLHAAQTDISAKFAVAAIGTTNIFATIKSLPTLQRMSLSAPNAPSRQFTASTCTVIKPFAIFEVAPPSSLVAASQHQRNEKPSIIGPPHLHQPPRKRNTSKNISNSLPEPNHASSKGGSHSRRHGSVYFAWRALADLLTKHGLRLKRNCSRNSNLSAIWESSFTSGISSILFSKFVLS